MSDRRDPDVHRMVMEWPDDAVAEIESLRARAEMLLGLLDVRESELVEARSRLAEADALLREALPAVQSYARKHGRAVVAAARRNDADHVAKHAAVEQSAWGLADKIRAYLPPDSAPAAMERPWQEIVKDATRYMWLRRRVDTAPAHGLYPWSDAAAMDAAIDAGMAATSQPRAVK